LIRKAIDFTLEFARYCYIFIVRFKNGDNSFNGYYPLAFTQHILSVDISGKCSSDIADPKDYQMWGNLLDRNFYFTCRVKMEGGNFYPQVLNFKTQYNGQTSYVVFCSIEEGTFDTVCQICKTNGLIDKELKLEKKSISDCNSMYY